MLGLGSATERVRDGRARFRTWVSVSPWIPRILVCIPQVLQKPGVVDQTVCAAKSKVFACHDVKEGHVARQEPNSAIRHSIPTELLSLLSHLKNCAKACLRKILVEWSSIEGLGIPMVGICFVTRNITPRAGRRGGCLRYCRAKLFLQAYSCESKVAS